MQCIVEWIQKICSQNWIFVANYSALSVHAYLKRGISAVKPWNGVMRIFLYAWGMKSQVKSKENNKDQLNQYDDGMGKPEADVGTWSVV